MVSIEGEPNLRVRFLVEMVGGATYRKKKKSLVDKNQ